ncbi:prepilin-type N-terminal cleavage/methylation domain-containing protein [Helicobacter sp. WB40]|uniref:prepilin-type N-terminal cleavage/methylation domain-containing protein n=1 Tax=Helicobacter sp. WB40 TaxID=3004130 RepID=UPI0022EBB180|nr:prepilin-type N-terminal cleavage/methylation domain-containing protein [Helicobacter sp. WB40]MDA3968008.1 prepilin-type N-terminal cleavage/methylation domain-containing protein [Helicobacter sp. WB40]
MAQLSFKSAFSLLELVLTLLLLGILLSFGIPNIFNYNKSVCNKALQLQILNLKIALKNELKTNQTINIESLYKHLDMSKSSCYFEKQKGGFIGINEDKKVFFKLKNNILECEHTKSSKLHNGESFCDIF